MVARLALAAFLFTACGGNNDGKDKMTDSLLGAWETHVDSVALGATFSGDSDAGVAKLTQTVPGNTPSCEISSHTEGTFTRTGTSIAITVASARQKTSAGCDGGPTDTAETELGPLQNFASALSGPFVVTETTLKLGSSYPTFTRVPE